jgi:hypothetical protein
MSTVRIRDGWAIYTYKAGSQPESVVLTPDVIAPTREQAFAAHPRGARLGFEYKVRYVVIDGLAFVLPDAGIRVAEEDGELEG